MDTEKKTVNVWFRYQLGRGPKAKMFDDKKLVNIAIMSEMVAEIEKELSLKHADEVKNGKQVFIDRFDILGSI